MHICIHMKLKKNRIRNETLRVCITSISNRRLHGLWDLFWLYACICACVCIYCYKNVVFTLDYDPKHKKFHKRRKN